MNRDFRVSTSFFRHHKIIKLKRRLGYAGPYALLTLWAYAAENKPEGSLAGMDAEDIAIAALWEDDSELFVSTLRDIGLLDQGEGGVYCLHEWREHNPWAAEASERSDKARLSRLAQVNPAAHAECISLGIDRLDARAYSEWKEFSPKNPQATLGKCADDVKASAGVISGDRRATVSKTLAPSPSPSPTPNVKNIKTPLTPRGGDGVRVNAKRDLPRGKKAPHSAPAYSREFLEFMDAFQEAPNDGAWKAWGSVCSRKDFPGIMPLLDKLDRWQQSGQWQRGFAPSVKTYLRDGYWQREPRPEVKQEPRPTTMRQANIQAAQKFAWNLKKQYLENKALNGEDGHEFQNAIDA